MKLMLSFVVVAALGAGGWYFLHQPVAAEDSLASLSEETGGLSASAPRVAPAPSLPQEVQLALQQADAQWTAAGPTPASSPAGPALARAYSGVLRRLYNRPGARSVEERVVNERLNALSQAVFFSKQVWPGDAFILSHQVVSGDSPDKIARANGMSRELLNRLRAKDVNDSKLRIGETLKVLRLNAASDGAKGFFIHIDKGDFRLDLYAGGMFVRRYPMSHGAPESPTPIGRTQVINRVWHPDWTHPKTKQVIRYGEPDHVLGPIWLPFEAKELGVGGIGIHGYTGLDAQMGALVSNGCIRLQNQDAEELYHLLSHPDRAPTAVEITD